MAGAAAAGPASFETEAGLVVVITGASSGIGRATAQALARRGWLGEPVCLVLAARSDQSLADVVRECAGAGVSALAVTTDVSDGESVEALFDAAVARYGSVDVVVHSAAVVAYGRFEDVPAEVFDQVIATVLTGTANVARTAIGRFRTQGSGTLIIVGSLLGKIATPMMSAYVTAKWAIHGLTRVLQIEARRTPGIDVSLIWPGSVDTPTYAQAANYVGRGTRPPPPVASPQKVADAVVRAVDKPRRETSVGIANHMMVAGFRVFPGFFDVLVGPLMHVAGLTRVRVAETTGNVFEPRVEGEALSGRWKRHPRRADAVTEETDMGAELEANGAEVVRDIEAPAKDVWAVLCDGWAYASWVVGTARIRAVDAGWPEQGTKLQHSFGVWPALLDDHTEVLSVDPLRELMLKARGWPAGEAHVHLLLTPDGPSRTRVRIIEDAVAGPGVLLPRPVRQALIVWRNTEALRRLAYLAEGNVQSAGAP